MKKKVYQLFNVIEHPELVIIHECEVVGEDKIKITELTDYLYFHRAIMLIEFCDTYAVAKAKARSHWAIRAPLTSLFYLTATTRDLRIRWLWEKDKTDMASLEYFWERTKTHLSPKRLNELKEKGICE